MNTELNPELYTLKLPYSLIRYGVELPGGVTIQQGAFDRCDGEFVPVSYNHPGEVVPGWDLLGPALIRAEGERIFAYFNPEQFDATWLNPDVYELYAYSEGLKIDDENNLITYGWIRAISVRESTKPERPDFWEKYHG